MKLKKLYSSREVAQLTGLTARQLQWWDKRKLFPPAVPAQKTAAGGFTERRYTPIELLELFVLSDLRARGFTIQQLHTLVRSLADYFAVGLYEATGGGGKITLLTDGSDIYARTESGEFYNVLKAPTQPLLVLGTAGEGALLKTLGKLKESRSRTRKSGKPVRGRRPAVE